MSILVHAQFATQAAAAAAMDRIEGYGVPHGDISVQYGENIGRSPATSSSPTTVVSHASQREPKEDAKDGRLATRTPTRIPDPAHIGACTVTVRCSDTQVSEEILAMLRQNGGGDVRTARGDFVDDAAFVPTHGQARQIDVDRAIDASRGGAALSKATPKV